MWQLDNNTFFKAIYFTIARILKCNQLFDGGFDYPIIKLRANQNINFSKIKIKYWYIPVKNGKYLVFNYKGKAENGPEIFRYIFQNVIPENQFEVDNRPHFEIFGEDYNPNDDSAEEEIWIPIR